MEAKLVELVNYLASLAPEVWRVLIRQQYVEAGTSIVWAIVLGVITAASFQSGRRFTTSEEEANQMLGGLLIGVAAIFAVIAVNQLIHAGQLIANPEFYAITQLIRTAQGR